MNTCSPCRARSSRVTQAPRKVEVVVLDLEVLSKWREHVKRELVVVGIRIVLLLDGEAAKQQRKGDWYVNGAREPCAVNCMLEINPHKQIVYQENKAVAHGMIDWFMLMY